MGGCKKPRKHSLYCREGVVGATRAGSNLAIGTPLPYEMRSLGYPTKNSLRGTIAILKGNMASRQIPFFRDNGPSGLFVARVGKILVI